MENDALTTKNIVFYDGDCGFCNKSVHFILQNRRKDIYFIALQDQKAKDFLRSYSIEIDYNTLYFYRHSNVYNRSQATLKIAKLLRFPYPLLSVAGLIIPRFIRDAIYNKVSANRQRISPEFCVVPQPEEKIFFI